MPNGGEACETALQREEMKTRSIIAAAIFIAATMPVNAQVAPGWTPTGEWQCGPVRVISSTDGFGGVDFFVIGAWFDNHYTLQRGQLYYNGNPCLAVGDPWAWTKAPRRKAAALDGERDDSAGERAGVDK